MRFAFIICCCLGLVLTACKEEAPTPFLKIVGGSFIFNYRYSKMSYGFVARQLRPLPDGSILRLNYEAHNGYPYYPVGRDLIDRQAQQLSGQSRLLTGAILF